MQRAASGAARVRAPAPPQVADKTQVGREAHRYSVHRPVPAAAVRSPPSVRAGQTPARFPSRAQYVSAATSGSGRPNRGAPARAQAPPVSARPPASGLRQPAGPPALPAYALLPETAPAPGVLHLPARAGALRARQAGPEHLQAVLP